MPISLLWSLPHDELTPLSLVITDKSAQTLGAHFAAMLVASNQTFPLLLENSAFKSAFAHLWGEAFENKEQCIRAQKAIFDYLQNAPHVAEATLSYMYKLNKAKMLDEGIISHVQKLAINEPIKQSEPLHVKSIEAFDFHEIKAILKQIGSKVNSEILEQSTLQKSWNETIKSLNEAKFSVGITGVMNAGKSTMLNALLGGEILGTSTVPETANLTIISHAKSPNAKVNFWKKSEWELIQMSAISSPPMAKFVEDTKSLIAKDWDKFITNEGYSESIEPKNLALYTSATASKGRCNIVKSVELGLDVALAGQGVSIVDTPGLDDPIIQREEITKSYLANCDAMVHLMNASQSATKKDVDFIIEALTYQRISHLVLVITRIDGIDEASLQEVIDYTKKSISKRLKELEKPHLIDPILEKISIFPVAGLYALMHKIGKEKEALKDGWTLERSGIEAVEKHLYDVLFGGERAHIMLRSSSKSMLQILQNQEDLFINEERLLGQSSDELEQKRQTLKEHQDRLKSQIQNANSEASGLILTCIDYLTTMEKVAIGRLKKLQTQVNERLGDDVRYSVKKTKQLPASSRLETIVTTALGDGLVDLVREYRFELFRYLDSQFIPFLRKYEGILGEIEYLFDPKGYQEEAAKSGILSTNYTLMAQNAKDTILEQKPKNASQALEKTREVIAKGFEPIQSRVLPLLYISGENMIANMKNLIDTPIQEALQKMELEASNLEAALLHVSQDKSSQEQRLISIKGKIDQIRAQKSQITTCMEVI